MPTKTEKKLESNIVKALTEVCENYKEKAEGFEWLTHVYKSKNKGLKIYCVFQNRQFIQTARADSIIDSFSKDIITELFGIGVDVSAHDVEFIDESEAGHKGL
ncbi:Fis family transcriptional regulator [Glaciecola sp. KUL10]|uniref:Fis family transcriptional regulator n=1 Tax=Glaciecola sp. (strain KUL10) TaxID=2161813 RepID=UPI000D78B589|nr:Fis family transcriptional regulator [Glaciecola sp. KUL10]GBL06310.1 hypothetical protein KUL10_36500 [Glaciecola sp. KUL10]